MKKKLAETRTVYVLGAGFSIPAGMPAQTSILKKLEELEVDDVKFLAYRDLARSFIQKVFHCRDAWVCVSLEDIYTLLDRAIAQSEPLSGYEVDELRGVRDALNASITHLFDSIRQEGLAGSEHTWVKDFAEAVAQYTSRYGGANRGQAADTISFISLNWDIILDHALFRAFILYSERPDRPTGAIDYGTYFDPYDPTEDRLLPNSLVAAMRGLGTVKLLKLHASMNWLYCSECGRLFVKAGEKIALAPASCRRCNHRSDALMFPLLLTPTFIKDMNNIHIKQIWHSARLLLREADRIVFVGYSFPQADFEFRLLLNKNARTNSKIEVVNFNDGEELSPLGKETEDRYKWFFGERKLRFDWDGTEHFIIKETVYWQDALIRG